MKRQAQILLVLFLLACSGIAQAPKSAVPVYEDVGYTMDAGDDGLLVTKPGQVVAIRAPDGLYIFQNADTALLIWRDSTFVGAATGFVSEVEARARKSTDAPPERWGRLGVMYLVKFPHASGTLEPGDVPHDDMYAGLVYSP